MQALGRAVPAFPPASTGSERPFSSSARQPRTRSASLGSLQVGYAAPAALHRRLCRTGRWRRRRLCVLVCAPRAEVQPNTCRRARAKRLQAHPSRAYGWRVARCARERAVLARAFDHRSPFVSEDDSTSNLPSYRAPLGRAQAALHPLGPRQSITHRGIQDTRWRAANRLDHDHPALRGRIDLQRDPGRQMPARARGFDDTIVNSPLAKSRPRPTRCRIVVQPLRRCDVPKVDNVPAALRPTDRHHSTVNLPDAARPCVQDRFRPGGVRSWVEAQPAACGSYERFRHSSRDR
jgi:hypothetical protein